MQIWNMTHSIIINCITIFETDADVVYGSRFLGGGKYVRIHFWRGANKILTFICNLFTNLNLTMWKQDIKFLNLQC